MLKKPTDELNKLLENMKLADLDSYLSDNNPPSGACIYERGIIRREKTVS